MDSIDEVLQYAEENMEKAVEHAGDELRKIRAGKASPAMLDNVKIDYYGMQTPVNQAASINVADARTLLIKPFEPKFTPTIEKAILDAKLGVNPQNDGDQIRVSLPMLTEERRKELVKQTKEQAEDSKIGIRNIRREANDQLKKLQKAGEPEDAVKAAEQEIQKKTDANIQKIDNMLENKEEEIMTV